MTTLIHITRVERIPCADLVSLVYIDRNHVKIPSDVKFIDINIVGLAQMSVDDDIDNLQSITTSTLKFNLCPLDNVYGRFYAYRLTSANGQRYLVGCSDRPFPVSKCSRPFPDSASGSVLQSITVTLKSTVPLLFVTD
jgi:hypothetical protein